MSVDLSIGEVESLVMKACRGAGMSWGAADDAGKAAGCLAAHNLPGLEAFAGLVRENDGIPYVDTAPNSLEYPWRAGMNALCPVAGGCTISDMASTLDQSAEMTIGVMSYPLIFLGFAMLTARRNDLHMKVVWQGVEAICTPLGVSLNSGTIFTAKSDALTVQIGGALELLSPQEKCQRGQCPDDVFKALSTFAHRTYVPATEQSRLSGAGAGLTDND